jgi:hypothetical protein
MMTPQLLPLPLPLLLLLLPRPPSCTRALV